MKDEAAAPKKSRRKTYTQEEEAMFLEDMSARVDSAFKSAAEEADPSERRKLQQLTVSLTETRDKIEANLAAGAESIEDAPAEDAKPRRVRNSNKAAA